MEAVWMMEVENLPAFVLVDDKGNNSSASSSSSIAAHPALPDIKEPLCTREQSRPPPSAPAKQKQVDTRVRRRQRRGILIVFTGNGKGKSTAAFGTATRAVGTVKPGVAQFIKGQWDNGEYNTLHPLGVEFHIMGTGFTWETKPGGGY
jgi:hypothetical protein